MPGRDAAGGVLARFAFELFLSGPKRCHVHRPRVLAHAARAKRTDGHSGRRHTPQYPESRNSSSQNGLLLDSLPNPSAAGTAAR